MDKSRGELTVMEAVDHLTKMSELDLSIPVEEKEVADILHISGDIDWANPKEVLAYEPLIKEIFRVLHHYLQELFDKERERLKDPDTQRGIQALMLLASEAAQKMDKFSSLTGSEKMISKLKEYKELQKFYLNTIVRHLELHLPPEEEWEKNLGEGAPEHLEAQKRGIKDLESVRQDGEYELFFIKKENGKPYFNRDLLRHLKLVGNFDQLVESTESEDPLLWMKVLQDKEVHLGAIEILRLSRPYIDAFYRERISFKENAFVGAISKALMALMMAAHSDNLLESGSAKGCVSYYSDFHRYLRLALSSSEYRAIIATAPESQEPFDHILLNLSHALCCFFFTRLSSREEAIDLIKKLTQRGESLQKEGPEENEAESAFWKSFLDSDSAIRYLLKHYPSGPLLKTLDALRGEEVQEGFDPLIQQNFPGQLYSFNLNDADVSVIRLPSPTHQIQIQECQVAEEFLGMLRYFKESQPAHRFLLVNLQDRTSWEDFARADALETLSKKAEFSSVFTVVSLPKQTDFYSQANEYEALNGAPLFIEQFLKQIDSGKECGYFFPDSIKPSELSAFCKETIHLIHHYLFGEQHTLTRRERMHFIELFYHFLALKLAELTECDILSFTCKDALDTGAAASAGFYAFLRLLTKGNKWSQAECDLLLWLFYCPALIVRERAIDPTRLKRAVLALEVFEKGLSKKARETFQPKKLSLN